MNMQNMFLRKLKEELEEQKKRMIEKSVEEYREALEASLSGVVDEFMDSVMCTLCSNLDEQSLRRNFEFRVVFGDEFRASRDTGESSSDKQQE